MRGLLRFGAAAALIAGAMTTIGVLTAPPAEACVGETCGASRTELVLSAGPYDYGEPITMHAIVMDRSNACALPSDLACTQPTGEVHFKDGGDLLAIRQLVQCFPREGSDVCLTSSDESETIPGAIKRLSGGDHTIRAEYHRSGDDGFNSSETSREITIRPIGTSTSLQQSSTQTVVGQTVTFTATVTPARQPDLANGVLPPSGSVDFVVDGASLASDNPDGQGIATWTTTLDGGTHSVFARYNTDFSYAVSQSSPAIIHTVVKGSTTTGLTQTAATTVFGEPFTLTGTVASSTGGTPTGTVTFKDGATTVGSPVTLSGGVASTDPVLVVGTHSLSASYAGDTNLNGSTSNTLTHTVNKASTTSVVNIAPASATNLGGPVTLDVDVTVNHPGAGTPTGTVQFKDGTTNLGGPLALTPTGATLVTSALGGGAHTITAVYSGDGNFAPSTSALTTHTVLCTTTVNGSVSGTYNVPAAGTTCISGANITGGINIPAGAKVSIVNSTVGGYLQATNAAGTIIICGTTLPGITINNAAGAVTIGDPYTTGCASNVISGGIGLASNHGGLRVNGNRIASGLTATGNNGGSTVIGGNAITGWLQCSGNTSVTNEGRPNTAGGRTGQCATPANF